MGNCVLKGFGVMEVGETVKVVTAKGGIMEFLPPITAECVTNEFPGHAIYRSRNLFSPPLLHDAELIGGHLYYLLPLNPNKNICTSTTPASSNILNSNDKRAYPSSLTSKPVAYRMSFDDQRVVKRSTDAEVFPRYNNNSRGVWKVKLAISSEQLAEILSQEARMEELIENVRTVVKCGYGFSSSADSDQCSISSSRKGLADEKHGLVI